MLRAARILGLVDRLRGEAEVTISQLATEFGVSERTLQRDLAVLRDQGMPIAGQAGPGGGVRLEGTRGLTAVHLSLQEVLALWLASRLSREASLLPWSGAASSGLGKLLASIPRQRAESLRSLLRRVFVGRAASPALARSAGPAHGELLTLFEEAFASRVGLGFRYTDAQGRTTRRRIEPHGLLIEPPVWYILARDADKSEPRTFRMDRIDAPRLAPEIRFNPDARIALSQLPDTGRYVRADSGRAVVRRPIGP